MSGRPSTNGHTDPITDPALRERVANLAQDVTAFRGELHDVRSSMATRTDILNLQSSIAALSDRQKPQPALLVSSIGLVVTVLVAIGTLAYWPINTATSDLKSSVASLADKIVTQRQYDADTKLFRDGLQSLRNDLTTAINSTIQQQRYNADKAARDGEMGIMRERFEKVLTKSDFDSQHGDLKNFITQMMASRDRQLQAIMGRIDRLENIELAAPKK